MPPSRIRVAPVAGAAELFTPEFTGLLLALHDRLGARVHDLIGKRAAMLARAHAGTPPRPLPPSPATAESWRVPPVPADLRKPGIHPALMEDLATGRMSVAQLGQRIIHRVRTTDGPAATHDFALVKRLLQEETDDILARLRATATDEKSRVAYAEAETRYRKSLTIAMRWIKNYTDLNFRSLGSYTRADLDEIAAVPDAF